MRAQQTRSRGRTAERGSAALEALIIVPVCLAAVAVVVMAGRLAVAQQVTETAAADAARAGSIARSAVTAQADARTAAERSLTDQDLNCTQLTVDIDASQIGNAVGQRGAVTATITCHATLSDLASLGILPGSVPVTASMTSPIDRFRSTAS